MGLLGVFLLGAFFLGIIYLIGASVRAFPKLPESYQFSIVVVLILLGTALVLFPSREYFDRYRLERYLGVELTGESKIRYWDHPISAMGTPEGAYFAFRISRDGLLDLREKTELTSYPRGKALTKASSKPSSIYSEWKPWTLKSELQWIGKRGKRDRKGDRRFCFVLIYDEASLQAYGTDTWCDEPARTPE